MIFKTQHSGRKISILANRSAQLRARRARARPNLSSANFLLTFGKKRVAGIYEKTQFSFEIRRALARAAAVGGGETPYLGGGLLGGDAWGAEVGALREKSQGQGRKIAEKNANVF